MVSTAIYDIFKIGQDRSLEWFGAACDLQDVVALVNLHSLRSTELLMVNALGERIALQTGPDCKLHTNDEGRVLCTQQKFPRDWILQDPEAD